MPELPEVETVARDLRGRVLGARILGVRCDWPRTIRTHSPEALSAAVAARVVEGVGRRGKLVVIELSGDLALTIHLKMTGQLFVVPNDAPRDRHTHLVFSLDGDRELRFRDIRKFGRVGLYERDPVTGDLVAEGRGPGGAESFGVGESAFGGFGPEPLDEAFTLEAFRRLLHGRRGRLKPLLLDQSFLAGIGNIYADEALWMARLHPLRSAATLSRDDERRLFLAIRTILAEAVARRGSSIDDYTAPDGDGSMQEHLQVYQRTGEPCPRCGRSIRRIVLGARATHFCSWCQRLPATDRTAARRILGTMAGYARRGPRWTELAGDGTLGLTKDEAAAAAARARSERTRRAAATRRAEARGQANAERIGAEIARSVSDTHSSDSGLVAAEDREPFDTEPARAVRAPAERKSS